MTQVGSLQIRVEINAQTIVSVSHDYQRPLSQISGLLLKASPDKSCDILPLVFSVCGVAHKTAGLLANALLNESNTQNFRQKILLENLREIIFRLVQVWKYPVENESFNALSTMISECLELTREDANKKIDAKLAVLWAEFFGHEKRYHQWLEHLKICVKQDVDVIDESDLHRLRDTTGSERNALILTLMKNKYLVQENNEPLLDKRMSCGFGADLFTKNHLLFFEKIVTCAASVFCEAEYIVSELVSDKQKHQVNERSVVLNSENLFFNEQVNPHTRNGWVLTSRGWLKHSVTYEPDHARIKSWDIEAPTDVNFGNKKHSILAEVLQGLVLNGNSTDASDERSVQENTNIMMKIEALTSWLIKAIDPCLDYSVEVCYA